MDDKKKMSGKPLDDDKLENVSGGYGNHAEATVESAPRGYGKPIDDDKLENAAGGYSKPSDGEYWALKEGKPERKYGSDD